MKIIARRKTLLTASSFPVYGSYLAFQLFSHKDLYRDDNPANFQSTRYPKGQHPSVRRFIPKRFQRHEDVEMGATNGEAQDASSSQPLADARPTPGSTELHSRTDSTAHEGGEEVEEPTLSVPITIGLLAVVTVVSVHSVIR
jgi:Ca2+:H+ antiporter